MLLLKNCRIFDAAQGEVKEGDILIEGGKIIKVAPDVAAPPEAEVIDIGGDFVMPGLIDAHSHIGTWVLEHNGNDANECVNPVTPGLRITDALNPGDPAFQAARAAGITTVMITPGSGNVIGGQCAVIKTAGRTKNEMIVKAPAALKMAFGENPKRVYAGMKKSPSSRMATAALVRETLFRARLYARQKRSSAPPPFDLDMEAFIPVFQGKIPLKIHAHRADDIMTAVGIAAEFGLRMTLEHGTEGHMITEFLKDRSLPVIIGPSGTFRSKVELRNATLANAAALSRAGVAVSFMSDHPFTNCAYLTLYAAYAHKHGLEWGETLKALTINPARALEVADRVGSIEPGKDADITVFDGDPLELATRVRMTLINGAVVYGEIAAATAGARKKGGKQA